MEEREGGGINEKVPYEILQLIFAQLSPHHYEALCHVRLVCRLWERLTDNAHVWSGRGLDLDPDPDLDPDLNLQLIHPRQLKGVALIKQPTQRDRAYGACAYGKRLFYIAEAYLWYDEVNDEDASVQTVRTRYSPFINCEVAMVPWDSRGIALLSTYCVVLLKDTSKDNKWTKVTELRVPNQVGCSTYSALAYNNRIYYGEGNHLVILNIQDCTTVVLSEGHAEEITTVALWKGKILTAGRDNYVQVRTLDGTLLSNFKAHDGPVIDIKAFGASFFTASSDRCSRIWQERASGEIEKVQELKISGDDEKESMWVVNYIRGLFLTGGYGYYIRLWYNTKPIAKADIPSYCDTIVTVGNHIAVRSASTLVFFSLVLSPL